MFQVRGGKKQGRKRWTSWEDGHRVQAPWHYLDYISFLHVSHLHCPSMQTRVYISYTTSIQSAFHTAL